MVKESACQYRRHRFDPWRRKWQLTPCLRKDGLALQSKTGNQLSSPDDMGCRIFHPVALLKFMSYTLEMGVSGNLWIVVKDVKTRVVYDVE